MKLETFVLVLVCVIAGMGATFWVSALLLAAFHVPFAAIALLPAGLVGYVLYRVIAERVGSAEEDHYDGMDH